MLKRTLAALTIASFALPLQAAKIKDVTLNQVGRYTTGVFDDGAAEIVAYDPATFRLFVINASAGSVDILDIFDPTDPMKVGEIDVAVIAAEDGAIEEDDVGGVNSVAVKDGLVAVAVENANKQAPGWAAFFGTNGNYLNHVMAGALPDAITFTPNGSFALTANEGEPNDFYTIDDDPEGSITVVDLRNGVMNATASHADFTAFNSLIDLPDGMRAPRWAEGSGFTLAQDLEPEFIATSHDSRTAWVTLQENNGLAVVDIRSATVTELVGLGKKDHSMPGNGLDASNRDDAINIQTWPVLGTYMPDSIFAYRTRGRTYLVTANEGDGREYIYKIGDDGAPPCLPPAFVDGDECVYTDEARVKEVVLDDTMFTDPDTLQEDENLGRIKMLNTEGNPDGDEDYDEIHTFGTRSISIWRPDGTLVFDTGETMEYQTAMALTPDFDCFNDAKIDPDINPEDCSDFNSTNDENQSFDDRSDDKGPEPEGVVVGKVKGRYYAFVGLERVGGIMIFDVTRPEMTRYVDYINNRDFSVEDVEADDAGDLGPEGLVFIKADDSPTGIPLLVVGNEVSGSTTIYEVVAR